jgi:aarF domain-containing kinase
MQQHTPSRFHSIQTLNLSLYAGDKQTCPDPDAFKAAMSEHFQMLVKADESNDDDAFSNGAEALSAVLELVRVHQVNMPGHICAVVVTTLILEGWSHKLDPSHSVLMQVGLLGKWQSN